MKTDLANAMLALAGAGTAQNMMYVGGAIPQGVMAPSVAGFNNATLHPSRGGAAICVSGMIPVQASTSKNLQFNYQVPQNESQLTETWVEYITAGSPFMQQIMNGTQTVSGTYDIAATYCIPPSNPKPSSVQLLTHGIGFDRYYWDFAPGYSYVDFAAQAGYGVFFYDRLGVGKSVRPDGLNVVQTPLEVEIAHSLAAMLREGMFAQTNFTKVIGVGHSYGSIISQAITASYPSTFDAAVLTGFSVNTTAVPAFIAAGNLEIASLNQPYRFAGLNNSYMVTATVIGNQIQFFRAPNFDPAVLAEANANKGTVTIGEFFSLTASTKPAMNYTGPVAVVDGANDLPFCFGNCSYPSNQLTPVLSALYPNVPMNMTGTFQVPVTGHGINLHYSAQTAYNYIMTFLKGQGC
ncbi:hypothetical protein MBLNU457_5470t1 [Dothideomycetes sp. NU457]